MAEKITVPTLGESVTEATVSKWLKTQGDQVTVDEPIVELETDKVNVEVPAPANGILGTVEVKEGETVNVGSLLGTINNSSTTAQIILKKKKIIHPPIKEKVVKEIIFEEEKIKQTKKKVKKKESALNLEEEPLILEQVHDEGIIKKE